LIKKGKEKKKKCWEKRVKRKKKRKWQKGRSPSNRPPNTGHAGKAGTYPKGEQDGVVNSRDKVKGQNRGKSHGGLAEHFRPKRKKGGGRGRRSCLTRTIVEPMTRCKGRRRRGGKKKTDKEV